MQRGHLLRACALGVPLAILLLHVGVYLFKFPRYSDGTGSVRICAYEWEREAWYPLSAIEAACRDHRWFLFIAAENRKTPVDQDIARLHLSRVWP